MFQCRVIQLSGSVLPTRNALSQFLLCLTPRVSQKQEIVKKVHFVFLRNTRPSPTCAILTA